ncbi:MAG: NUDIX domain-containing protein [Dehalococcoidia bacterium]
MPEEQPRPEPDGAAVILYTPDQVLLQKRDRSPRRFPGRWAVFGGGIQPGETPESSACREVGEELGLSLKPEDLELLGRFQVIGLNNDSVVHFFRAPLRLGFWDLLLALPQAPRLDLEGEGLALFTHDEVDNIHLRCHDRIALERHFQGRKFGFID